ncbi:hypothetical protein WJX75_008007 [Coccomyxa subellipsoidea]
MLDFYVGIGWGLGMAALGLADARGVNSEWRGKGLPQIILAALVAYVIYFAVLCSRMQDASQWPKGRLMTHTLVLITLCMFSWSRFWLRQMIGLVFPVPATDCYMLIASRVAMAYMLILAAYVAVLTVLYLPRRQWWGMWYSASVMFATDALQRTIIPIFGLATLDNYSWCTRGINHINSGVRDISSGSEEEASRQLPCYHVDGGRQRPGYMPRRSAHRYKVMGLSLHLGSNIALAAVLTLMDDVDLPGWRMTLFDAVEIAGYIYQGIRLFALGMCVASVHRSHTWRFAKSG